MTRGITIGLLAVAAGACGSGTVAGLVIARDGWAVSGGAAAALCLIGFVSVLVLAWGMG
jgi:hypothetical protein